MSDRLSGQDYLNGQPLDYLQMRQRQYEPGAELLCVRHNPSGYSERVLAMMARRNHISFISADGCYVVSHHKPGEY